MPPVIISIPYGYYVRADKIRCLNISDKTILSRYFFLQWSEITKIKNTYRLRWTERIK